MSSELSMFPMKPLDSVIKKRNQGVNTTTEKVAYSACGIPVIRSKNIKNNRIDFSDVVYVDQKTYEDLKDTCKPKFGDILFTNIGEIGNSAVVETDEIFIVAWNVLRVQSNEKVNNHYLSYVLSEREVKGKMNSLNSSSTLPFVSGKEFGKVEIPLPTLDRQKSIVEILKPIDDRINLLRETNTTLEAIAQALFKSWFVDFDPVHVKMQDRAPEGMDKATAALFPDSFEESELGPVPRGWGVGKLSEIASLKGGKMLDKASFTENGEHPVFGGAGVMGYSSLSNAEGFVITVGRVGAYCGQYFWHQGKAWVNNNASLVSPSNPDHSCWLFLWLKSVDMDLIKKGAAQPFVSNGDISELKIVLPPNQIIENFVQSIDPIFQRLSSITNQIKSLESLRDTLLPRLISGQISLAEPATETI